MYKNKISFPGVVWGYKQALQLLCFLAVVPVLSVAANEKPVASQAMLESLSIEAKTQQQSRKTQRRVDELSAQTAKLLYEYQRITQQLDYQEAYAVELEQKLLEQDAEIAELEQAIADIQITRLHLLPLLREMLDTLKAFILLDLPFEQDARLAAVSRASELLASSQTPLSEKFERVMSLYQAENDDNYSVDSARGVVNIEGVPYSVEFLRVGRLALYYQSLDGEKLAIYAADKESWLDISHLPQAGAQIQKALRIAKEQTSPEFMHLPFIDGAIALADLARDLPQAESE